MLFEKYWNTFLNQCLKRWWFFWPFLDKTICDCIPSIRISMAQNRRRFHPFDIHFFSIFKLIVLLSYQLEFFQQSGCRDFSMNNKVLMEVIRCAFNQSFLCPIDGNHHSTAAVHVLESKMILFKNEKWLGFKMFAHFPNDSSKLDSICSFWWLWRSCPGGFTKNTFLQVATEIGVVFPVSYKTSQALRLEF